MRWVWMGGFGNLVLSVGLQMKLLNVYLGPEVGSNVLLQ